ncbi:MAG: response regulator [Desulfobacterales bacterium]|nr:response regulator [Desulfobacterales bacterium]
MTIDPKKITILLVEDAAIMRKIETKTLKALGFDNIIEAKDGNFAIEHLQGDTKIDLIISDWNMPNKDGFELLVWVRDFEKYKNIPFLMATGQGDKKQENKAVEAGVSAFVAKPFNENELREKIDEAFGLVEEEAEEEEAPQVTKSGKVLLRMAHIQITDHLALGVLKSMIEKGDLKPKYFELDVQCMAGWNPVQQALEKGAVEGAFVLAPIAMDLYSYGAPIKLVLLAHKSGSIFVRSRQGDYTPPFQNFFRNKTFLIPHKMSVHHMLAHLFFRKIGLKSGMVGEGAMDVNFEVVAPIKMQEYLENRPDAAGFMVAEPLGTKAIATGAAELQFLSSELWENHPCCVVTVRDKLIELYPDAVYELTDMLVQAGAFIERKPEVAAEIGVGFLDPMKKLGLKVPILKNVLMEKKGLKTGDLFPNVDALKRMHSYMLKNMGIGTDFDMDEFVDARFAEAACKDRVSSQLVPYLHDADGVAADILNRSADGDGEITKAMLNLEGKYLTFSLAEQDFGIDIQKVREIVGMQPVRSMPQAPPFVMGVINLRGKVIPVMDLRLRFGMGALEAHDRNCIIVIESMVNGQDLLMGLAVDSVSEVLGVKSSDIESTPHFGPGVNTSHILAMYKQEGGVKLLLDIDHVLKSSDLSQMNE